MLEPGEGDAASDERTLFVVACRREFLHLALPASADLHSAASEFLARHLPVIVRILVNVRTVFQVMTQEGHRSEKTDERPKVAVGLSVRRRAFAEGAGVTWIRHIGYWHLFLTQDISSSR